MRVREEKICQIRLNYIMLYYIYNLENIRAQAGEKKVRVRKTKKSKKLNSDSPPNK